MGLRYCVPLPGPFYYSGRAGPKRRFPRSSHAGCGPMGFMVKYIVYPSIICFGAGLAIMVAPFYGVFWVVRRWQRNRWKCRPVAQPVAPRFPVRRPMPQCAAPRPGTRSYGFVPAPAYIPSPGARRGWPGRGVRFSKLGESLPLGWRRVLRLVRSRGGGHDCVRPVVASPMF